MRKKKKASFFDTVMAILWAGSLAILIRTFTFEPFHIPSDSMIPNLLVGDHLFVNKFSYGYSRHSFPFSPPLIRDRIFFTEPERGDVIVFKKLKPPSENYIKRLIGIPGDRLQMKAGRLYINGVMVERESLGMYYVLNLPNDDRHEKTITKRLQNGGILRLENTKRLYLNDEELPRDRFSVYFKRQRDLHPEPIERRLYIETLPNGEKHRIIKIADFPADCYEMPYKTEAERNLQNLCHNSRFSDFDNTVEYEIPAGHYFMMGDNRDISADSRHGDVGFVARRELIGRAAIIFYSHNGSTGWLEPWRWLAPIRWERLLKWIG